MIKGTLYEYILDLGCNSSFKFTIARNDYCEGVYVPYGHDSHAMAELSNYAHQWSRVEGFVPLYENHTKLRLDDDTLAKIGWNLLEAYRTGIRIGAARKASQIRKAMHDGLEG